MTGARRFYRGWGLPWLLLTVAVALAFVRIHHQQGQIGAAVRSNTRLINRLDKTAATLADIERAQDDSCSNYLALRGVVNRFHTSLYSFLLAAEKTRYASYRRQHQPVDLKAARTYHRLRLSLKTASQTCAQRR